MEGSEELGMHRAGGEAKADGHCERNQVRRPEAKGEDPAQAANGQRKRRKRHQAGLAVSGQARRFVNGRPL